MRLLFFIGIVLIFLAVVRDEDRAPVAWETKEEYLQEYGRFIVRVAENKHQMSDAAWVRAYELNYAFTHAGLRRFESELDEMEFEKIRRNNRDFQKWRRAWIAGRWVDRLRGVFADN